MKYAVDAHALIWFVQSDKRLGPNAHRVLTDSTSDLVLPAIALAEACWIVEHGRTNVPSDFVLLAALDADPRFTTYLMVGQVETQRSGCVLI